MKIWMQCSTHQLDELIAQGQFQPDSGFAITPEWALEVDDDDEEFLEDAMLEQAGENAQIVVVAQASATVTNAQTGQVALDEPVNSRKVLAYFAKSDVQDDEFSWFGPTESANLKDFLAGIH